MAADAGCSERQVAALSLEHQQLLAFVGSYVRHFGCLPTATEAATACGYRSPRPAARLYAQLERQGWIHRDEHYARLGSVELPSTIWNEADQLWLAERACVEHRALIVGLQAGLRSAPDFDTVDAIHAEGVTRSTVLRSLVHAATLLREGGATIDEAGRAELEVEAALMDEVLALLTDWNAYCIVQLVWNLSARQFLADVRPLEFGYLGASYVASRRAIESLLPTYRARAAGPLSTDPRVPELLEQVRGLLDRLRRHIAQHFPSSPKRLAVNVDALLAG